MASRFPTRYMALLVAGILVCINMAYLYTSQRSPFRYKARSKYTGSKQNASFTGGMYDVVLAFGDSTTQFGDYPSTSGWLTHLSRFYERRMDVLNRGFSGYTTIDARNVVELVLPETASSSSQNRTKSRRSIWPPRDDTLPTKAPTVRLLILFFGANDSVLEGYDKHVPLAAFSENLRYIASLIRDPKSRFYAPETRILFVTPPTIGDKMYGYYAGKYGLPVKRKNKVTKLYAEAVKAVAKTVDAP
ncbi:isoamyl acetate-hydrolyzing esterase, partial [Dipsacomyces acuminosporus]